MTPGSYPTNAGSWLRPPSWWTRTASSSRPPSTSSARRSRSATPSRTRHLVTSSVRRSMWRPWSSPGCRGASGQSNMRGRPREQRSMRGARPMRERLLGRPETQGAGRRTRAKRRREPRTRQAEERTSERRVAIELARTSHGAESKQSSTGMRKRTAGKRRAKDVGSERPRRLRVRKVFLRRRLKPAWIISSRSPRVAMVLHRTVKCCAAAAISTKGISFHNSGLRQSDRKACAER